MNGRMIGFIGRTTLVLAMLIAIAGCPAVQIVNVKDAPVKTLSGKDLTFQQVTKAIVLAGMGLKWEMVVAEPGHIVGTLNLRSHQAVVDIPYTTKTYSITYKDSKNLLWKGLNSITKNNQNLPGMVPKVGSVPTIHSNYNGWIENLDNAIRMQIVAIEQ